MQCSTCLRVFSQQHVLEQHFFCGTPGSFRVVPKDVRTDLDTLPEPCVDRPEVHVDRPEIHKHAKDAKDCVSM